MLRGSKLTWFGAAVLVASGLFTVWARWPARPARADFSHIPAPVGTEDRAELVAMNREVSLLRAEVAGLKDRVYQPAPAVPEAAASDEPPLSAPSPPATPQAVTADAAQAHFERVFASEAPDIAWARTEEAAIGDFVHREGGDGSSLDSIACRSSMCRMQLRFSDDRSRDAFKLKLGTPPLNNGGFYKEEGETGLVYFAARAGHPLPPVPTE